MNSIAVRNDMSTRAYRGLLVVLAFIAMVLGTLGVASNAYAADESEAYDILVSDVEGATNDNSYQLEGGGNIKGNQLWLEDGKVNTATYEKLSDKGKNDFVKDSVSAARESAEYDPADDKPQVVTDATLATFLKNLQETPGIGTKMLNEVLQHTQPDFAKANDIIKPFSGIFGTLIGVFAVLTFTLLGLTIAADLAYITIPSLRFLGSDGGGGGGAPTPGGGTGRGGGKAGGFSLISDEAKNAVTQASDKGSPIWTYIKSRAVAMFFLALALVFLVGGQMWTLVGIGVDLVSGFFGG